jgi:hypothetical protein
MKFLTLASCILMASTGTALAAHSHPTPMQKSMLISSRKVSPSGRPSAILSKSECRAVWKQAISNTGGKTLNISQAQPYVDNFYEVDKNGNGRISKTEFKRGCKNGWIQASSHKTIRYGKSNPNT